MAVGTGKGGDANRRQQVARCPVAQAGLGDADGSLVTLVVDRHDTALACNLALRRDRPVPEDRLLPIHRITVRETQTLGRVQCRGTVDRYVSVSVVGLSLTHNTNIYYKIHIPIT